MTKGQNEKDPQDFLWTFSGLLVDSAGLPVLGDLRVLDLAWNLIHWYGLSVGFSWIALVKGHRKLVSMKRRSPKTEVLYRLIILTYIKPRRVVKID